jgi:Uma2 family endonuclease
MTAHALMFVDKPTFYRFIVKSADDARYEFVRGWIMQQQAGGTLKHARLGLRFAAVLDAQLDPKIWLTTGSDRAIDTGDTVRYADTVVEKLGAPADSLATEAPWLIVEVLSPSSEERDLATKPVEYLGLASLQAYIVASQNEPLCYVWLRGDDGAFAPAPLVIKGRAESIQVSALSATIPLAEVYRGIGE